MTQRSENTCATLSEMVLVVYEILSFLFLSFKFEFSDPNFCQVDFGSYGQISEAFSATPENGDTVESQSTSRKRRHSGMFNDTKGYCIIRK